MDALKNEKFLSYYEGRNFNREIDEIVHGVEHIGTMLHHQVDQHTAPMGS